MKIIKPLTAKEISLAKIKDKNYRLYDGGGLSLLITSNNKIWHFNYTNPQNGKRTIISLGKYPEVTLAEAREKRDLYRGLLAKNIDPQNEIKKQKQKVKENRTFSDVVQEWYQTKTYAKSTAYHIQLYLSYADKFIGNKNIGNIDYDDVIELCDFYAKTKSNIMARFIKSTIAQVFDYAVYKRLIKINIVRHIKLMLPQSNPTRHSPAITNPKEFAKLIKAIDAAQDLTPNTKIFLQLMSLLFVRSNELVSMQIADIDFDKATWTYTPTKTQNKTKVEMMIPLARQAVDLIKQAIAVNAGAMYVFYQPNTKNGYAGASGARAWLHKHGYQDIQCLHGFRASARTLLEEKLGYDYRMIEMQLGHQVRDANGRAYNRVQWLDKRREMMQAWADYLDSLTYSHHQT